MILSTMKTSTLPHFQGKPLIECPETVPQANFLTRDFGKAVLEEVQGRARADHHDAAVLNVLSYHDGVVTGSNAYVLPLIGSIVRQQNLHVATPADLELVIKTNAFSLQGTYEDFALVLRSKGEPNSYLARHLAHQVTARGHNLRAPLMIPYAGLELINDSDAPEGLAFKLREDAAVIEAPILKKPGRFNQADVDYAIGLPRTTGKTGERILYSGELKTGLSRLYLDGYLVVDSSWNNLAGSDGDGRVVVVSRDAISQNAEKTIMAEYKKKREELDARKDRAIRILDGKE